MEIAETGSRLQRKTNWWGAFVIGLAAPILVIGLDPPAIQALGAAAIPLLAGATAIGVILCLFVAELAEESGAELVAVHVRHESAVASAASSVEAGAEAAISEALDDVERLSRERVADVLSGRRVQWRFDVASGDPATELIAVARHHQATTIVVGGRTHGVVGGLVVGSVAQKLVRHSPVSVLVVRDGQAHRLAVASSGGHS